MVIFVISIVIVLVVVLWMGKKAKQKNKVLHTRYSLSVVTYIICTYSC